MIGGVVSRLGDKTSVCHTVSVNRIAASPITHTYFYTIYDTQAITGTPQALIVNRV